MASKKDDLPRQKVSLKRTVLVDPKVDSKDGQYLENVIFEPAVRIDPEVDPEAERYHHDRQKRLWKRIEEAKRPSARPPAREKIDGIPVVSIGISTTGIDYEFNFRLAERKRDFEDSVSHMLGELNYAIRYNKTLSAEQREHLKRTRVAFEKSIGQLKERVRASGPEDGLDLIEAAIAAAYEIGAFGGRHPIKGKLTIAPAAAKTKGRPKPKWYAVADGIMAELTAKRPSVRGSTPSKRARSKLLHKHLSERLEKLEMKSVSEFAVRDYLTYVGRKRT